MTREPEQIFLLNHSESQLNLDLRRNCTANAQDNLENVKDFSNVCRTCAAVTEFIVPIFEGEGLQNKLADKIHQHLPIKVSEQDSLPRVVCYQCASTLLAWHELVKCCLQADEALKTKQAVWAAEASIQEKPGTSDDVTVKDLEDPVSQDETKALKGEHPKKSKRRRLLRESLAVETFPAHVSMSAGALVEGAARRYVTCPQCGERVCSKSWRRHEAMHAGQRFLCMTCGQVFTDAGNRRRHQRHVHERERPHACTLCARTFARRHQLSEHVAAAHRPPAAPPGPYVCETCGAQLRWRGVRDALVFHCAECGRYLPRRALLAHMAGHARQLQPLPPPPPLQPAPPAPRDPPDEFSDHSDDNENRFAALPESVFEAIEDSQDATREDRPTAAVADVDDKKPSAKAGRTRSCPTCGKQYAAASSYFYHVKHAHASSEAERPHKCATCSRGFKTRGALRSHSATHGSPALPCARCGRSFRSRAARLLHACGAAPTGEAGAVPERWPCGRCARVFPRRAKLLRHERRHAPRSLRCPHAGCSRSFHVGGDLARHARTHAPPARARCPHAACSATFAQPRYLRVHLANKHNDLQPNNVTDDDAGPS